jgi:poly(3-hydroxybutyrate) depolymerase
MLASTLQFLTLTSRVTATCNHRIRTLMVLCLCCLSLPALAQSETFFTSALQAYGDLTYPQTSRPWGPPSREGNDIFRPAGEGPFPVVVVAHTCGGIEPHIYDRAKELLDAGYMVLVMDSYTSRRHFVFCTAAGVGAPRVYKDAYDALNHLKKLPDADSERIYLVGFSLGSFVAAVMSSPAVAQRLNSTHRYRATVGC